MPPATSQTTPAFHGPASLASRHCPADFPLVAGALMNGPAGGLTGGRDVPAGIAPACGLQATAWDLAQFEPLQPTGPLQRLSAWFTGAAAGDPGIQASAALRGQGLLAPAQAQPRAERLLAQGRTARDILQHYAQARTQARLPGDAAWVATLAAGQLPLLLAGRDEFARLAYEAAGEAAAGPVVVLPGGAGVLVDPNAFFQQGSDRPSARALRALQATFIHPRCNELLKLTAQLGRYPKDRMEEGLDLLVMGRTGADAPEHLKAALEGLVQGDETAVVRALLRPQVPPLLALSPLLDARLFDPRVVPPQPAPEDAARELEALAIDALAHAEPHRARTQTLLGVLGPRARATLANAFVRADMASLQRVLAAYSVVVFNDVVRAWLQPVCGDLDALRDLGVKVRWHDGSDSLRAVVGDDALPRRMRSRREPLAITTLTQFDRETRMAGASAAIHWAMDLPPDPPAAAGRGTLARAQLEAATGRPPLVVHVDPGDSPLSPLQPAMLLAELIVAYADGYALGAAQGFARTLDKDNTGTGPNLVVEYLGAYIGRRLTGQPLVAHHAAGATATQRVIQARAALDGIPFEQAERHVLGLVFGGRSFGSTDDLRQLKRLTLSLHEQRKLDLLRDAPAAAGQGTPLHVIGGTVATGAWMRPVGRLDEAYRMQPLTALPAGRIPGTFALGDGTLLVDPEHIVSVILPPAAGDDGRKADGPPLKTRATDRTSASRAGAS